MANERPIALVGLSGAGKSAVAESLAELLGGEARDLDAMIEAQAGSGIAEIFAREGEEGFRRRESSELARALEERPHAHPLVLALGGGVVVEPANRRMLADRCRVIWLQVSTREAARRIEASGRKVRPLLEGAELERRLAELLEARSDLYAATAHVRIETEGRSPRQIADDLRELLGENARRKEAQA